SLSGTDTGQSTPPSCVTIPHGTRIILHVGMDSFYASVEMHKRPELAKRPVIIGADPRHGTGRGVVATCSYEARACGVHSAMPISQAYSLCPDAVFLPPDLPLYTQVSGEIMSILRSHEFRSEQVSIDEAFLDVTPLGDYRAAQVFAQEIKDTIRARLGITCSIGVAPSKIVAKIASGAKKPDGLMVVEPTNVAAFLATLPVRKICGIGKKTDRELNSMGILTIGDLRTYDIQALVARFGRWGIVMHNAASGADDSEVQEREGARSISREHTFLEDTDDPPVLVTTINHLAADVYRNLLDEGLRFRTLTVKVRYTGFVTRTRSKTLSHYSDDPAMIRTGAQALFRHLFDGQKVRLIGLRLSNFMRQDARQTCLFNNPDGGGTWGTSDTIG
ncbi:MAG: DNA polymerase IV, partial [Methanoregula sp.]